MLICIILVTSFKYVNDCVIDSSKICDFKSQFPFLQHFFDKIQNKNYKKFNDIF